MRRDCFTLQHYWAPRSPVDFVNYSSHRRPILFIRNHLPISSPPTQSITLPLQSTIHISRARLVVLSALLLHHHYTSSPLGTTGEKLRSSRSFVRLTSHDRHGPETCCLESLTPGQSIRGAMELKR